MPKTTPPKSVSEHVAEIELWRNYQVAAYLHLPLYLIKQAADFPPPDEWRINPDCEAYQMGACDEGGADPEESVGNCETCKIAYWRQETVRAYAKARGLVFAATPYRKPL
jgi:hypothetical protein